MTAKFDYRGMQKTASRLLTKFGQSAVLRVATVAQPPDSDAPSEPWDPGETAGAEQHVDYPCVAIVTNYPLRPRPGTLIKEYNRHVYVAVDGVENVDTNLASQIILGGHTYEIVTMTPTEPGGLRLMFDLQVEV